MLALLMTPRRRMCWLAALLAWAILTPLMAAERCDGPTWPLWQNYAQRNVQEDGRMLESSMEPNHSTSEGQSYGMVFALVANDRKRFDALWSWTVANMMGSDKTRLPGWLWGQGKDGAWQLQDANSASDADLWMAYTLLEAARLWQAPAYRTDALALLKTIESRLVVDLPGVGKMVLPGPEGFIQPDHLWRLNPSYLPIPLLRRLAKEAPNGPWKEIADNTLKMIQASSPKGFVADWLAYRGTSPKTGLFVIDPAKGELGSYDAIRVYLWAGMTPASDPLAAALLARLDGMSASTASSGVPPEKVQVMSGASEGQAPFGYSAALLPYFQAKGHTWLVAQQRRLVEQGIARVMKHDPQDRSEPAYYNLMLSLFALGWIEQRYQFRSDGTLELSWETSCPPVATR
ncbi:cellulose synthase complex periplasmic endoglucanase BcsZ [Pseudomonas ovata]|uniref:cellulose synthase complex periplasmic endoglucanase BcsZ n=1 Tax=Pseudomonas ovata TaxID=1839709 RepID=UPI000D69E0CE|nr:cellulose synthase complex periplasmic endoglucanase BcsZ [Pseudomonas ovata]